ncbi:hypothetical protein Stsp01_53470 [Streptomyces sp. NBRC 13847]|nr:hypothetical protein Stsp01_53470 [Streptomyces sp. NBRC 13847]
MRVVPRFLSLPRVRPAVALAVGVSAVTLMAPSSASAAASGSWTYVSQQECTFNKAETNRSSTERAVAFGKAQVQAWKSAASGNCRQVNQRPAGFLMASADLYKWNDQLRGWQLCRTSGRVTNSAAASQLEATVRLTADAMPCGNGWYGTVAGGWQFSAVNRAWVGGTVWSGSQLFTADPQPDAPAPPAWSGADGIIART